MKSDGPSDRLWAPLKIIQGLPQSLMTVSFQIIIRYSPNIDDRTVTNQFRNPQALLRDWQTAEVFTEVHHLQLRVHF